MSTITPTIEVTPPSPHASPPVSPRTEGSALPGPSAAPRRKFSHSRAKSIDVADLHAHNSPEKEAKKLHVPQENDSRRSSLDMVRRGVDRLEGKTRELRNRASFEISRLPSLRILEGETHDKRVHWGELFGDLMYIIAVQALSDRFAHHPTLLQAAAFLGLYLGVYWSWCGEVMYLDRFETNDLLHRVALFVEMVGVMFMVIALRGNDEQLNLLFPISYIIIRSLFVVLYGRIAIWIDSARTLALTHSVMLLFSVSIWLGSIWVPQPWNYILWAVALVIDLAIPVVTYYMEKDIPLNTSHMGERLGLFIIIDLGEMVLATVRGLGDHLYAGPAVLAIFYGISIAYSCWWLYFDEAGFTIGKRPKILKHALQRLNWISKFWFYNHFFLNVSLTTVGVGLELLVHYASKHEFSHVPPVDARWIFAAGLITFLASLGGVHLAHYGLELKQKAVKALFRLAGAVAGLVIVIAAGPHFAAWLFILCFLVINVVQILFDLLFHESWVVRAADRRRALSKAMAEKFKEQADTAPPETEQQRRFIDGRRSLDEPRPPREHRLSLDIPRRPAEV